jgi:NNP family nitrate/nitrite transporter-like MFS transporter
VSSKQWAGELRCCTWHYDGDRRYFVLETYTRCPQGNFKELRAQGVQIGSDKKGGVAILMHAARNYRVWILFGAYAACFGIEIFIHNIIAMYYVNNFSFGLKEAGFAAGIFGLLALFARALGGIVSDKVALKKV